MTEIMNRKDDYIFRYPLEVRGTGERRGSLLEMIRTELGSLLSLLSLYRGGEEVKPDGFRLMNEREAIHPIFPREKEKVEDEGDVKHQPQLGHPITRLSNPPGTPSCTSPESRISRGCWRASSRLSPWNQGGSPSPSTVSA